MAKIQVLNGPNLNLLGQREPTLYGSQTLDEINAELASQALSYSSELVAFQSNSEGELLQAIHQAPSQSIDFILINAAALTHTSIALRDALLGVALPFIEIHISNVYRREDFRHHSYLADIAVGVISGLGTQGYSLALSAAFHQLNIQSKG